MAARHNLTQDVTYDKQDIRAEGMRIGGKTVHTDKVVEVRYPYTDEVIGTVPAGTAEHARQAFEIAAAYQPKLTRYERQQILFRAAELIRERREEIAHWLTLELHLQGIRCMKPAGPTMSSPLPVSWRSRMTARFFPVT